MGKGQKYVRGGTPSSHAQEDFGRGSVGQTWKAQEEREVWDKDMQEEK